MLKSFFSFIVEGGNIKTEGGDASPFPVTERTRWKRAGDIHGALSNMHDQFHKESGGQQLFGMNKSGLQNGSTYAGSTRSLMDKRVASGDIAKHMPNVGDVDAQMHHEHKNAMAKFLFPGRKFGKYIVLGTKKHGNEVSAVMKHENGEHHQFDFEGVHTDPQTGEPTPGEQFLHSADFSDRQRGIKGLHHKVLLNSIASANNQKFSITHGLRSRDSGKDDPGLSDPNEVSAALFGPKADHSKVHSFQGLSELIKKHIPPEKHADIFNKFASSVDKLKGADHTKAIAHLAKTLNLKMVNEEAEPEHHTSVVPLTGFSPISHMGHALDLGSAMRKLPGTKHVGVSSKSETYSANERKKILSKQWGAKNAKVHVVKSAGETVRAAHDSLPEEGKKHLHILVGHDRAEMAHGLKKALEAGKIKEMEGRKFDSITIHHPEDTDRSHGMSGTKLRAAAASGDVDTVHKHLGPMFTRKEAEHHTAKIAGAIKSGALKVKR